MCGIAGEFIFAGDAAIDPETRWPMISVLGHRGPDAWGYYLDDRRRLLFLHSRLSIVDLAGGHQPLCNEDGTVWVSCNGEIYDDRSLAAQLEDRGHRFRTRSDTEVIVHLYEEYGEAFLDHLRGEYAIALYDAKQDALYLIRDRFGVKPLYYCLSATSILFGSEIKAVLSHPESSAELDPAGVVSFLSGIYSPQSTVFRDILQVEPATFLKIRGSSVTKKKYWHLRFASRAEERRIGAAKSEGELVGEFLELFEQAVRLRLRADVEVGVYLSGGIDSMAVTALMAGHLRKPFRAFTVGFENPAYDESAPARQLAEHYGLDHQLIRIGDGDLASHFVASLWHSEIPVWNTHGTAKFLLSRLAGRQLKVVLTGEGGDELLAGYLGFRHQLPLEAFQQRLRRNPGDVELRRRFRQFLATEGLRGEIARFESYRDVERIRKIFGAYPYPVLGALVRHEIISGLLAGHLDQRERDPVADFGRCFDPADVSGASPISVSQYLAYKTLLPAYLLNYLGDRQEMAHSVEGRVPLLDHKLVEFGGQLPLDFKIRQGVEKYLLREAVAGLIPPSLVQRRKKAFMAPGLHTLGLDRKRSPFEDYFAPEKTAEVGIFDPDALGALRSQALAGGQAARESEPTLILALSLHILDELFLRSFPASAPPAPPGPRPGPRPPKARSTAPQEST